MSSNLQMLGEPQCEDLNDSKDESKLATWKFSNTKDCKTVSEGINLMEVAGYMTSLLYATHYTKIIRSLGRESGSLLCQAISRGLFEFNVKLIHRYFPQSGFLNFLPENLDNLKGISAVNADNLSHIQGYASREKVFIFFKKYIELFIEHANLQGLIQSKWDKNVDFFEVHLRTLLHKALIVISFTYFIKPKCSFKFELPATLVSSDTHNFIYRGDDDERTSFFLVSVNFPALYVGEERYQKVANVEVSDCELEDAKIDALLDEVTFLKLFSAKAELFFFKSFSFDNKVWRRHCKATIQNNIVALQKKLELPVEPFDNSREDTESESENDTSREVTESETTTTTTEMEEQKPTDLPPDSITPGGAPETPQPAPNPAETPEPPAVHPNDVVVEQVEVPISEENRNLRNLEGTENIENIEIFFAEGGVDSSHQPDRVDAPILPPVPIYDTMDREDSSSSNEVSSSSTGSSVNESQDKEGKDESSNGSGSSSEGSSVQDGSSKEESGEVKKEADAPKEPNQFEKQEGTTHKQESVAGGSADASLMDSKEEAKQKPADAQLQKIEEAAKDIPQEEQAKNEEGGKIEGSSSTSEVKDASSSSESGKEVEIPTAEIPVVTPKGEVVQEAKKVEPSLPVAPLLHSSPPQQSEPENSLVIASPSIREVEGASSKDEMPERTAKVPVAMAMESTRNVKSNEVEIELDVIQLNKEIKLDEVEQQRGMETKQDEETGTSTSASSTDTSGSTEITPKEPPKKKPEPSHTEHSTNTVYSDSSSTTVTDSLDYGAGNKKAKKKKKKSGQTTTSDDECCCCTVV